MKNLHIVVYACTLLVLALSGSSISGSVEDDCKPINEYLVNILDIQVVRSGQVSYLKVNVDFVNDPCVCGVSYADDSYCSYLDQARASYWYDFTIDGSTRMDYIASILLSSSRPEKINLLLDTYGQAIGISLPQH